MKTKPIKMNFPPTVVRDHVRNWVKQAKGKEDKIGKAMLDDIQTMVDLACENMTPIKTN